MTIHRTTDALEAEILVDLLEDVGIVARVLGAQQLSAPFGLDVERMARVEVPPADAAAAQRLIAEHLAEAHLELAGEPPEEKRLSPLIAAGAVAICPGGSHLYARRPLVAIAIAAGELGSVLYLAAGDGRAAAGAGALLLALLLWDLVLGQLAARAWNRGVRIARRGQAWRGALVLASAGILALFAAPLLEQPLRARGTRSGRHAEMRSGAVDPRQLPFPLHLDFRR